MLKITNGKKFSGFLILVGLFILSGFFLGKQLLNLKKGPTLKSSDDKNYTEGMNELLDGNFDQASEILEDLVDIDNPEQFKSLAISKYNQKEYDEAEIMFKELLSKDPDNKFQYYNSLANIYRDQKAFDKAVEFYEKAIQEKIDYEIAYQNLVILYLYEKNPADRERANEVLEMGLVNIPESDALKKMKIE